MWCILVGRCLIRIGERIDRWIKKILSINKGIMIFSYFLKRIWVEDLGLVGILSIFKGN